MSQPIRIGFIGASAGKAAWANKSHMPYLNSSRNNGTYAVTAIQNSSQASSEKARDFYSLPSTTGSYGDPASLANDPNVDLVAVSVNVPGHYDAIMPALNASKDVFVEWPLARNLSEAETMANLAREKNLHTMVGLQARHSPSIVAAKQLITSGAIGPIKSTIMHGYSGILGAQRLPASYAYCLSVENGANLLTVPFAHAVDALCFTLGELSSLTAILTNYHKEVTLVDESGNSVGTKPKTAHDHVAVQGTLASNGSPVSITYQPDSNPTGGPDFTWPINGEKGSILLEGPAGHVQMFQPTIKLRLNTDGDKAELKDVPDVQWVGNDFSHAVGSAWAAFAAKKRGQQITDDGCVTTFDDAVLRHRMIDAIYRSNETGKRETYL